jgi:CubicO group peptidase (beta-lactamase class C family)
MDPLHLLTRLPLPFLTRCRVPSDLRAVRSDAEEVPGRELGLSQGRIERIWHVAEALYRTGVHPALQLCVRHRGQIVLHRALGHAAGNAPRDPREAPKTLATTETPFNVFSAAKAVTAMVIHKLDDKRMIHLDDRVCDFIPEFARHGKDRITLRHLLAHRAGIPNLPPDSIDLDLLGHPDRVVEILSAARPRSRPGRLLAYHAVSGGFVLGEVVRRVTGRDIRSVLENEILEPLGLRWMRYGVKPEDVQRVALNAFTGPPVPPPVAQILRNALGTDLHHAVELSNDPRFLTGIIPSGNVVTTAEEFSAFFQCLLQQGELGGVRVFEPRTVRHATAEQSYWELDLTLGLPIRYGLGFMLGGGVSLFGYDNPEAFGHLGLSNVIAWADPERSISVALLTSGKPILSSHVLRLGQLLFEIGRAFPKQRDRRARNSPSSSAPRRRSRIDRSARAG